MTEKLPLVSASQVNLFRECERKWAYRYLEGIKTEQHPSAALGTEVDDTQLQPYFREGRPLDFTRTSGYIAAPGLVLLPEPGSCDLEVQKHFVLPSPSTTAFAYQGYIDLWLPRGGLPDLGTRPAVVDFKTTKNWKWAKTPRQLASDVQAQLYAAWALHETKAPEVDLVWTYFATTGKYQAKRVHRVATLEHVTEQLAAIDETAVRMFELRKAKPPAIELKPNVEMCGAYGGCPYSARCNLSPTESVDSQVAAWRRKESPMAESTMSLLAKMKAKAGQPAAPAAPAVEPPRFGTPPPVTDADRAEAAARVAAMIAEPTVEVIGINPPESKLPPAPPMGAVVESKPEAKKPESVLECGPGPGAKKPGRPRKADAEPTITEVNAAIDKLREVQATEAALEAIVTVTWAEESFAPIPYNTIKVGPFTSSGRPHPGETTAAAQARLYAELVTFAETVRAEKLVSFKKTIDQIGGQR